CIALTGKSDYAVSVDFLPAQGVAPNGRPGPVPARWPARKHGGLVDGRRRIWPPIRCWFLFPSLAALGRFLLCESFEKLPFGCALRAFKYTQGFTAQIGNGPATTINCDQPLDERIRPHQNQQQDPGDDSLVVRGAVYQAQKG